MALGPIEIVTIGFREGRFDGTIVPELERLVASGTIAIVDAVVVRKTGEESVEIVELAEVAEDPAIAALTTLVREVDGLLNDEDAEALVETLPVGAAAAVLCFEHTWVKPLRDAIVGAGGEMLDSVRIPGPVAEQVLASVRDEAATAQE